MEEEEEKKCVVGSMAGRSIAFVSHCRRYLQRYYFVPCKIMGDISRRALVPEIFTFTLATSAFNPHEVKYVLFLKSSSVWDYRLHKHPSV